MGSIFTGTLWTSWISIPVIPQLSAVLTNHFFNFCFFLTFALLLFKDSYYMFNAVLQLIPKFSDLLFISFQIAFYFLLFPTSHLRIPLPFTQFLLLCHSELLLSFSFIQSRLPCSSFLTGVGFSFCISYFFEL